MVEDASFQGVFRNGPGGSRARREIQIPEDGTCRPRERGEELNGLLDGVEVLLAMGGDIRMKGDLLRCYREPIAAATRLGSLRTTTGRYPCPGMTRPHGTHATAPWRSERARPSDRCKFPDAARTLDSTLILERWFPSSLRCQAPSLPCRSEHPRAGRLTGEKLPRLGSAVGRSMSGSS